MSWRSLWSDFGSIVGRRSEWVIHTEAGAFISPNATIAQEEARMRGIHNYHLSIKYGGFGYNVAAFPSGRKYKGRGWFRVGAHVAGHNSRTMGLVFPGHGDRESATPAQVRAAQELIRDSIKAGACTESPTARPHNYYNKGKSCPGGRNMPHMTKFQGIRSTSTFGGETPPPPPVVRTWFEMATQNDLDVVVRRAIREEVIAPKGRNALAAANMWALANALLGNEVEESDTVSSSLVTRIRQVGNFFRPWREKDWATNSAMGRVDRALSAGELGGGITEEQKEAIIGRIMEAQSQHDAEALLNALIAVLSRGAANG